MTTKNAVEHSFQLGSHDVTMKTNYIGKQADSTVILSMGETVIMASVCSARQDDYTRGFFPLTVDYREKAYAAGRFPGGFLKREGRPSDKERLVCRAIDRGIRPLFADGFSREVQVIVTVLSMDPDVPADVPAVLAASAALSTSGLPFDGPIGVARVAYILGEDDADDAGEYVINPSFEKLGESSLDMFISGTTDAITMVESEAMELSEAIMITACEKGHVASCKAAEAITIFAGMVNKPAIEWQPEVINREVEKTIDDEMKDDIIAAINATSKQQKQQQVAVVKKAAIERFVSDEVSEKDVSKAFSSLQKKYMRVQTLSGKRTDGRELGEIRGIEAETGLLPRTHGSGLFTRGETQALVTLTLGTERDAQKIDDLEGNRQDECFMLHYNFPPSCVGECGFIGSPKRREIGHGRLAKRAMHAVSPTMADFPYVIRLVSEVTESNGSSSMATVCGSSLALMDAGVPITAPVSGIAMGLIKEGNRVAILSDILGDEDHMGDMDFKVAGTRDGITALQMDIKIAGINKEILEKALHQARDGRLHILDEMEKSIKTSREQLSRYAPRIETLQIPAEKIRDLIGKGGSTIRQLTEETNTNIDISDEGLVKVSGQSQEEVEAAAHRIRQITTVITAGQMYDGLVSKVMDFGAIVTFLGGTHQGLVHISQIADEHVENVTDYVQEGQQIRIKVIDIDRQGRIRLSLKQAAEAVEGIVLDTED